jgi:ATP-dependent RNA helicase RhlB
MQQVLTDHRFTDYPLDPRLLNALNESGFERLTPIQALTLPDSLEGHDIAGQAQTGTGKTAAFLLAAYQRMLKVPPPFNRKRSDPRAVMIAPTRELAIQIAKDAEALSKHTGFRLSLVYGGVDYDKQREQFEKGVDVLVATPGRLIDYLKQNVFSLRAVDVFVLDEADRMFDLGFIKDIRFVLKKLPPREERQGMLFSATLSHRVMELAYEHFNQPKEHKVDAGMTATKVTERVYYPAMDEKLALLVGLMRRLEVTRSIVFVNTKSAADRISTRLRHAGIPTAVLSGDVPQPKRLKMLEEFAAGKRECLVATDVAARGLHIPAVSHVFNYDLPHDPEDYVHRIGRTARLGASGDAISFACENYAFTLPDIEAFIGHRIEAATVDEALINLGREAATETVEIDPSDNERIAPRPRSGKPGGGGRRPGGPPRGPRRGPPRG